VSCRRSGEISRILDELALSFDNAGFDNPGHRQRPEMNP
jgi:hypothetical protein